MIGAPFDGSGSAYLYEKPGSGWEDANQTAKLKPSDKVAGDQFGNSVAISGDTVVIGAHKDDYSQTSAIGSAYIYEKPGSGWVDSNQTAKFTASDKVAGDEFGFSVAISADTVVIGARGGMIIPIKLILVLHIYLKNLVLLG